MFMNPRVFSLAFEFSRPSESVVVGRGFCERAARELPESGRRAARELRASREGQKRTRLGLRGSPSFSHYIGRAAPERPAGSAPISGKSVGDLAGRSISTRPGRARAPTGTGPPGSLALACSVGVPRAALYEPLRPLKAIQS